MTSVRLHEDSVLVGWINVISKKHGTVFRADHDGREELYWFSNTLSWTSDLDGGGWFNRLTPTKESRYPLYTKLGGPQGRYGWVWEVSLPRGFDPRTIQPVVSYPGP